jgi:hypothetical protein
MVRLDVTRSYWCFHQNLLARMAASTKTPIPSPRQDTYSRDIAGGPVYQMRHSISEVPTYEFELEAVQKYHPLLWVGCWTIIMCSKYKSWLKNGYKVLYPVLCILSNTLRNPRQIAYLLLLQLHVTVEDTKLELLQEGEFVQVYFR